MGPSAASQQIQENILTLRKSSAILADLLEVEAIADRISRGQWTFPRTNRIMSTDGFLLEVEFEGQREKTLKDYLDLLKK